MPCCFPLSGWIWCVTEGDAYEDDTCFYGYVLGLEREWGYFCLSELESVEINGIKVYRDEHHVPRPLSACPQDTDVRKIERWTGCEWKHKHLPELLVPKYCHH